MIKTEQTFEFYEDLDAAGVRAQALREQGFVVLETYTGDDNHRLGFCAFKMVDRAVEQKIMIEIKS
jgi:hypothetical protein